MEMKMEMKSSPPLLRLTTAAAAAAALLLLMCLLSISPASSAAPTAYEVLKSYGFPAGLLPKGVTGYEINRGNGEFKAHLNGSCSFSISGYELKYRETITGRISREKLSNLKGVSVKILFFWVNIIEVTRNGGELSFSVGIASADFPVDNFEDSPTCGCGFDCKSKDEIGGLERLIQSS